MYLYLNYSADQKQTSLDATLIRTHLIKCDLCVIKFAHIIYTKQDLIIVAVPDSDSQSKT